MRILNIGTVAAACALVFQACAVKPAPQPGGGAKPAVTVDEKSAELEGVRPALRTLEDSLVLDVLLAYRQLQVGAGGTGSPDREIMRKGKNAYNQLEYLLRNGGIKDRGREGRAFTLQGGEKLTLQELTEQLSRVLLKSGADGNWKASAERAREIQRRRPDLSALVEDAGWCLALADALEGPLSEELKKRLRYLHESYAREAPHDEIVKQVNGLLKDVQDERMRKEMKKLANRSWERDKRNGKFAEPLASVKPDSAAAIPAPQTPTPRQGSGTQPDTALKAAAPGHETPPSAPADSTAKETRDRIDTLALHGRYLEALRALEASEDKVGADWAKERRQKLGGRYCEERRTAAATAYSAGRKAQNDTARVQLLRQSLAQLDSCLFNFPDSPVAAKVRRNREMVEKDLRR